MSQKKCDDFNAEHLVGSVAYVKRDNGETIKTVTTSEAYMLSGHTAVIHLEAISGCYALDRVIGVKIP